MVSGLSGCYYTNQLAYHDADLQLHEHNIVALIRNVDGRKVRKEGNRHNNSLKISESLYAPEEPKAIEDKIVSINVTEEVPIVDVIMELARMSGTDIQIDPTISGGVNLNLRDKPLRYVFNRICGLTNARYREKYGIVVFERDIPFTYTYSLDFLDIERSSSSSMSLNTSVISSDVSGSASASVSTSSSDSFWNDIVKDIKQIIKATDNITDTQTTYAEDKQAEAKAAEMGEDVSKIKSTKKSSSNTNNATEINVNRRAGLITVTASTKAQRNVARYLNTVRRKAMAQVLIEMRFLEVALDKEFESGINWTNVDLFGLGTGTSTLGSVANASGILTFKKGVNAVANLFEKFGSTRTLSNPRITAINNQPALMTIATNKVYFTVKTTITAASTAANGQTVPAIRNVDATANTLPLGVIMSVLPSIDIDNRTITINMKPTISTQSGYVNDPSMVAVLTDANAATTADSTTEEESNSNPVPIVAMREMDTILKLKDGQTVVMGGFTERKNSTVSTGVPILRSLPLIGSLFQYKTASTESTETIILVRATILDNGLEMTDYEKQLYETMSDDPRMGDVL